MSFDLDSVKWTADGLVPAIAQAQDGTVLMMAWMNRESLTETLQGGQVTYWSRSRQALWRKGETSGHRQRLIEARIDCDRDVLLMIVDQTGPACHTNRLSCFYTRIDGSEEEILSEPIA
ncbi:MAG: phosphoribosyl-AMP cyclohydrolase [Pseudomonadota bacterium]